MPFSPEFLEREQDILDNRWAGRLSNEEALKLLTDLWMDEYEARAILRMADECETRTEQHKTGAADETQ